MTEQIPPFQEQEDEKQPIEPRDLAYWAPYVKRIEVPDNLPPGWIAINVRGRRPAGPLRGFGKMWLKTYKVRFKGASVTPVEAIRAWKENYQEFWPEGNNFYTANLHLLPGAVAMINSTAPGGMRLSTGVFVLFANEKSFQLMTAQGHPFSGWVTFSAFDSGFQCG